MGGILEVYSEKETLDSHERLLDNSCPYRLVFHRRLVPWNLRMRVL
jgi:hypothetical protein